MPMLKVKVRGLDKKPTRYFSKKQETAVAKEVKGVRTPNSGAVDFAKGDVLSKKFLIECKTKTQSSKSISIKKEWLENLRYETAFDGKEYYSLAFSFGPQEENYFIINQDLFNVLREYLEELLGAEK